MQIIERVAGHYEVEEMEFGRSYKWCPGRIVVQCKCGKRMTFTRWDIIDSALYCECGKDNTANIREEVVLQLLDEQGYKANLHPWRSWHPSEESGVPF